MTEKKTTGNIQSMLSKFTLQKYVYTPIEFLYNVTTVFGFIAVSSGLFISPISNTK